MKIYYGPVADKKVYSGHDMLTRYIIKDGIIFIAAKTMWVKKDDNTIMIRPSPTRYYMNGYKVNDPLLIVTKLPLNVASVGIVNGAYEKKLAMTDRWCSPTPNGKKPYDSTLDDILFPVFLLGGILIITVICIIAVKTCRLKNRKKKAIQERMDDWAEQITPLKADLKKMGEKMDNIEQQGDTNMKPMIKSDNMKPKLKGKYKRPENRGSEFVAINKEAEDVDKPKDFWKLINDVRGSQVEEPQAEPKGLKVMGEKKKKNSQRMMVQPNMGPNTVNMRASTFKSQETNEFARANTNDAMLSSQLSQKEQPKQVVDKQDIGFAEEELVDAELDQGGLTNARPVRYSGEIQQQRPSSRDGKTDQKALPNLPSIRKNLPLRKSTFADGGN